MRSALAFRYASTVAAAAAGSPASTAPLIARRSVNTGSASS